MGLKNLKCVVDNLLRNNKFLDNENKQLSKSIRLNEINKDKTKCEQCKDYYSNINDLNNEITKFKKSLAE